MLLPPFSAVSTAVDVALVNPGTHTGAALVYQQGLHAAQLSRPSALSESALLNIASFGLATEPPPRTGARRRLLQAVAVCPERQRLYAVLGALVALSAILLSLHTIEKKKSKKSKKPKKKNPVNCCGRRKVQLTEEENEYLKVHLFDIL